MFKDNSTFYRIIIHTMGVLFLIGVLGSTALGDEGIFSTVVQSLYVAAFGPVSEPVTDGGILPPPPTTQMMSDNGEHPPPPDTLK